jgi:hypothetical protein
MTARPSPNTASSRSQRSAVGQQAVEQPGQQVADEAGGKEHAGVHQRAAPGAQRLEDHRRRRQHQQDREGASGLR